MELGEPVNGISIPGSEACRSRSHHESVPYEPSYGPSYIAVRPSGATANDVRNRSKPSTSGLEGGPGRFLVVTLPAAMSHVLISSPSM